MNALHLSKHFRNLAHRELKLHAKTQHRAFHPLAILGLLLFKKTALLYAIHSYGVPHLYRRMLEQNKYLIPKPLQKPTAQAIRLGFEAPTKIFVIVQNNEQIRYILSTISQSGKLAGSTAMQIPSLLVDISKTIMDYFVPKK